MVEYTMTIAAKKQSPVAGRKAKQKDVHYPGIFDEAWNDPKPLLKLFRTSRGGYIYDTGTNKILSCRDEVFDLVRELMMTDTQRAAENFIARYGEKAFHDAAGEIADAMKEENVFKVKQATRFGLSDHFRDIEEILSTTVQSINLEVTEDCNLRCRYCPYQGHYKGKRDYNPASMSLETAKKAIRFLKEHSSKSEGVFIGFYGGEPLLRPSFIKDCVKYAQEVMDGKKVFFNITTNAVPVTPGIAEFLFENGFSVMASIDGPEVYHDQYRVDAKGKGSFKRTVSGLKLLAEAHRKAGKGQIALSMVYTPPFSEEKIDAIDRFLKGLDWLPDVGIQISYPSDGTIPMGCASEAGLKQDKDLMQWAFERYRKDFGESDAMVKGVIGKRLAKLMQRPVFTEPVDYYSLNGCCVPGQRKNYIATDGSIHVCEKISSHAPILGHVDSGYDLQVIKKVYIDDYAAKSLPDCSRCWGLRLCDICYISAFNEKGEPDFKEKRKYCGYMLKSLERSFIDLSTILEENPESLDYLLKYELK